MAVHVPEHDQACVPVAQRIRSTLSRWADRLPADGIAIDIGAGETPPYRESMPAGWRYIDVDLDAGHVRASAIDLPFHSKTLDVAISNAVLEHLLDPAAAVEEMARVLRPGGTLILATHGTYPYHPCPDDYTRWTRSGLAHLIGTWFDVEEVEPLGGILLTLAILIGFYVELASTRALVLHPLKLLVPVVVRIGSWLDRFVPAMKDGRERYGSISTGYLVLARARG